MRHTVYIVATCILALLSTDTIYAQVTNQNKSKTSGLSAREKRDAKEEQNKEDTQQLSVRAQQMFNKEVPAQVSWSREIYRELSAEKEENQPLYYPVDPIDGRMNLFTLIFKLLAEGKINAYEYLDGREVFTDQYKHNFQDILEKYDIIYEEEVERGSKKVTYKIDESDIPSRTIKSFYIKEIYRFDQRSSLYGCDILCICPIMYREDDYGAGNQRIPMFWIPFESLKPYLTQIPVMTSNANNTMRLNYNDFFTMQKYKGDIYKTTNLANKSLAQVVKNDTSQLKTEREKIEKQLELFEESLWVKNDTTQVVDSKAQKKSNTTARADANSGVSKTKKTKSSKSAGTSARTVRASVRK